MDQTPPTSPDLPPDLPPEPPPEPTPGPPPTPPSTPPPTPQTSRKSASPRPIAGHGTRPVAARNRGSGTILGTILGVVIGVSLIGLVFLVGAMIGGGMMAIATIAEGSTLAVTYRSGNSDKIIILPVQGTIDGHRAEVVRTMVDQILDDRSVRAVVLRVDSPGGGVTSSDQIWYHVGRLQSAGLPVVASFGSVAASGGYYISCATNTIVCEPTTVTGSIGVIAQTFLLSDLMGKIGVQPVTLVATESPEKDLGNPMRPWTEKDYAQYTLLLDSAYATFNQRVKDGRSSVLEPEQVDALADGSIYTATQALDTGLVDSIGYLDDAIAKAEQSAGLTAGQSTVNVLHESISVLDSMFGATHTSDRRGDLRSLTPDRLRSFVTDLSVPRVMYLWQ